MCGQLWICDREVHINTDIVLPFHPEPHTKAEAWRNTNMTC